MTKLLTRRNLIVTGIVLVVAGLIAVLAWSTLRGGRASIDGRTVQRLIGDEILAEFSETLDVTETEARDLYSEQELEEAAEDAGLTREEFLQGTREVVVAALQQAVEDEEINAEQAERALTMTMRAITNHL